VAPASEVAPAGLDPADGMLTSHERQNG
jgi:hypothetical protein